MHAYGVIVAIEKTTRWGQKYGGISVMEMPPCLAILVGGDGNRSAADASAGVAHGLAEVINFLM